MFKRFFLNKDKGPQGRVEEEVLFYFLFGTTVHHYDYYWEQGTKHFVQKCFYFVVMIKNIHCFYLPKPILNQFCQFHLLLFHSAMNVWFPHTVFFQFHYKKNGVYCAANAITLPTLFKSTPPCSECITFKPLSSLWSILFIFYQSLHIGQKLLAKK